MVFQILLIALGFLSTTCMEARERVPQRTKRAMLDKTLHNVNELFDAMLQELNESHHMYHMSCKESQKREDALKNRLMAMQKENEQMLTIKAELALTQKDLEKALGNEAQLKERLTMLQQQAETKISSIRDEFDAVRSKLEATSNSLNKVFW